MAPNESIRQTSFVLAGLTRLQETARSSLVYANGIRAVTNLKRAWHGSQTETHSSETGTFIRNSTIVRTLTQFSTTVTQHIRTAYQAACMGALGDWTIRKTKESFLYRWLTAEPDPEVIVIDLRETMTAGPIIAGLYRTIATLTPGVKSATITEACRQTITLLSQRPVRYLGLLTLLLAGLSFLITLGTGHPSPLVIGIHILFFLGGVLGLRSTRSWNELLETRIAQAMIQAFEPPDGPERRP